MRFHLFVKMAVAMCFLIGLFPFQVFSQTRSYTFWYGDNPPTDLLSQFDQIIIEADNINDEELGLLKQHGNRIYAYLSIGEYSVSASNQKSPVKAKSILGENQAWKSKIMDLTSSEWQSYLLNKAMKLHKRGVDGFFLDTLDSYQLVENTTAGFHKEQQQGLLQILSKLKEISPQIGLVANRGFEIIDQAAPLLEAVAAESLYHGWDNSSKKYIDIDKNDRQWLLNTLQKIKTQYDLEIVIIDYLPPEKRDKARMIAKSIEEIGFIPWIATPSLDYMGIGAIEAIPRKILQLYDSQEKATDLRDLTSHRLGGLPLEYLGYYPVYQDIRKNLPSNILRGRVSGIILWLDEPAIGVNLLNFLKSNIRHGVPLLFMGNLDILRNTELSPHLGLTLHKDLHIPSLSPINKSDLIGFETPPPKRLNNIVPIQILDSEKFTSHLRMRDKNGTTVDLAATAKWGGFITSDAIYDEDFNYSKSWVIDPFRFFREALKLAPIPVPDTTTENGRRLFFSHIDGDGFMERYEVDKNKFSAEIILEKILQTYKVPHTISIVEGEIGATGLYPEISQELEGIAREIFALHHVEIASHSYSHPFKWNYHKFEKETEDFYLPIKGYTFNLKRDIQGTVKYINSRLAPKGKKTKVFLWTGNCLPTTEAIGIAGDAGLLNMNGGDTIMNSTIPSLTNAHGMGIRLGKNAYQVYAAVSNENIYTNEWTGPYYGFRRVVETFHLADKPRRLKPIDIYYHFYSGSKVASIKALQFVYDWVGKQETMPIFASDYIKKVLNFQSIGVSRRTNGRWIFSGLKELQTLRIDREAGWPDKDAKGIAGWRFHEKGRYLHIDSSGIVEFSTNTTPPKIPHLHQANGRLKKWSINGETIHFNIEGYVPVLVELKGVQANCSIRVEKKIEPPQQTTEGNRLTLQFSTEKTGDVYVQCDA